MKKLYTKEDVVNIVKRYDVRAKTLTSEQIDDVINVAYAEVTAIVQAFSNEEVINCVPFYDDGELKFTIDVEEDVTGVYDQYVTIEDQDNAIHYHGIRKVRDKNVIYLDNRYNGRVHIDLNNMPEQLVGNNIIIKYYYTPQATTDNIYMDQQTALALNFALGSSLYDYIHDVDRSSQKRAGLQRTAAAIIPQLTEDALDPGKPSMFPSGV